MAILACNASIPTATPRRFSDHFAEVTDDTPFSLASYHRYDVLSEMFRRYQGLGFRGFCGVVDAT